MAKGRRAPSPQYNSSPLVRELSFPSILLSVLQLWSGGVPCIRSLVVECLPGKCRNRHTCFPSSAPVQASCKIPPVTCTLEAIYGLIAKLLHYFLKTKWKWKQKRKRRETKVSSWVTKQTSSQNATWDAPIAQESFKRRKDTHEI